MQDNELKEMIKVRDEKIFKNLCIAKERCKGIGENTLYGILVENKNRLKEERINNLFNKSLKNIENKMLESDKFTK